MFLSFILIGISGSGLDQSIDLSAVTVGKSYHIKTYITKICNNNYICHLTWYLQTQRQKKNLHNSYSILANTSHFQKKGVGYFIHKSAKHVIFTVSEWYWSYSDNNSSSTQKVEVWKRRWKDSAREYRTLCWSSRYSLSHLSGYISCWLSPTLHYILVGCNVTLYHFETKQRLHTANGALEMFLDDICKKYTSLCA